MIECEEARTEKCPALLQFIFLLLSSWDFLWKHPGNSLKSASQESQRELRIKPATVGIVTTYLEHTLNTYQGADIALDTLWGYKDKSEARFYVEILNSWDLQY